MEKPPSAAVNTGMAAQKKNNDIQKFLMQKLLSFNHEPHEQTRKFFRVAALSDGIARGFVIWSIGFSD